MLVLEGRAYIRGGFEHCAIGIDDGRISSIRKTLRGDDNVDYGEFLILPGGIDLHVHFREPGLTHKEDFGTGTTSAAMGGITTVFDMPNTMPPTTTLYEYEQKVKMAAGKAFIDFGLYAALMNARETSRLAGAGASFKLYMAQTTGGLDVPTDDIPGLLKELPAEYPPVVVHAENPAKFKTTESRTLNEHNLARPVEAESSSIDSLKAIGRNFHITHVTSEESLKSVSSSGFTSDATPHHLLLDCAKPLGQLGKVNPPLRQPSEREAVWNAFAGGRIDILASDHAPHTEEEKSVNFADAPSGMPGVETMLPLMLRKVRSSDLRIERLINAVAERPAGLMGLNKGSIEVGRDADLVVVDSHSVTKVRGKNLHSKCGWTAFEGWEAIFPLAVYQRGNLIVDKGEVAGDTIGEYVEAKVPAKRTEPAKKPKFGAARQREPSK
jgi:dihydroorotase